ncbi:ATP-binding protein [Phytohabitans sp. LJ34]|uniref:sensor histidine kinase n=1 Tax=Phytohabitans sp. LJ34 TaxID=3452217 RepID=UPI003F890BDB
MARGRLRIYLGAAPGVGKTFAMFSEAHRCKEQGTDVVVGFVETYGREDTARLVGGLEVVPPKTLCGQETNFAEMDVDAVVGRSPQVVVVDELAHTNAPGSRNTKRWQDIQQLLDAGITVLSTVNIQHLESLNDAVWQIANVSPQETVPDKFVRLADQVELVDVTPEVLRRRIALGNVLPPDQVDAALGGYFRVDNLTALRELALLWLADQVDEQLDAYRAARGVGGAWGARERLVVALTGGPEGEALIRRAARIAARTKGAEVMAVHVARADGLTGADPASLARQRVLVESLGGTYHQVTGDRVPAALIDFARGVDATQLVLGASRRGRLAQILSPGVGVTTTNLSGPIDVHLVIHEQVGRGRLRLAARSPVSRSRQLAGFALTVLGLPMLTAVLYPLRDDLSLSSNVLLVLATVVAVALVGGRWPAVAAAVIGFLLLNFYFTEPFDAFDIANSEHLLALLVFLVVAVAVATVVDVAARRTREAAAASADASTLAAVAGSVLRGTRPLTALLERLRETFGLASVTVLERVPGWSDAPDQQARDAWRIAATVGGPPCQAPGQGDATVPVDDDLALVLCGRALPASDRRIVEAFAAQAALALRQERLAAEAAKARPLEEADKMRTALLAAVSHDLRTPLASAMAAVASLRSRDVEFSTEDQKELLATAAESHERLRRLIENLLDMSRLQAGALGVFATAVGLEDAVPTALDEIGEPGRLVRVRIPDDLATVTADPGLLQRILVNVIGNALRFSSPGKLPIITGSDRDGQVELRVIDHGPGIPEEHRDRVFQPFQRLGDRSNGTGVGLGLALSRGLAEAMGGSLTPETTPGGGLTMVLTLPAARPPSAARATHPTALADRTIVGRQHHPSRTGTEQV